MASMPSGQQFEISYGDQRATIVEVGGGVREYRVGDRDVLQPYPAEQMCDGAHGAPLIPWPNRLGGGRYRFDDADYQVALTEPDKHNAIHGFLRWRPWQVREHDANRVLMTASLFPLKGYPFALDVAIDYRLNEAGLTVTTMATNVGARPCPYGCGQHPYLSPGDGLIDGAMLHFDAQTRIVTDPERQLPIGTEPVAGTRYDFGSGKELGELELDDAFIGLRRDADGRARVRLTGADGRTVELWVDDAYPIIEIYTGDTLAPDRRRRGMGTEPMTCPPNALQSGEQVIRLEPGASATATWGVSLNG